MQRLLCPAVEHFGVLNHSLVDSSCPPSPQVVIDRLLRFWQLLTLQLTNEAAGQVVLVMLLHHPPQIHLVLLHLFDTALQKPLEPLEAVDEFSIPTQQCIDDRSFFLEAGRVVDFK